MTFDAELQDQGLGQYLGYVIIRIIILAVYLSSCPAYAIVSPV